MVGSRTFSALVGLLLGLLLSVVAWVYFDTLALFLFLPLVPFLFRFPGDSSDDASVRSCPVCGFRTRDPSYEHCPRDGHRLETDATRR